MMAPRLMNASKAAASTKLARRMFVEVPNEGSISRRVLLLKVVLPRRQLHKRLFFVGIVVEASFHLPLEAGNRCIIQRGTVGYTQCKFFLVPCSWRQLSGFVVL